MPQIGLLTGARNSRAQLAGWPTSIERRYRWSPGLVEKMQMLNLRQFEIFTGSICENLLRLAVREYTEIPRHGGD